MSKIKAIYHIETTEWDITLSDVSQPYFDLCIGFTNNTALVEFNNLKFKYELKQGSNVIENDSFPKENVTYISTDQEFILIQRLYVEAEKDYDLYLFAENGNMSGEINTGFSVSIPECPYPSWSWDTEAKQWTPPISHPSETIMHVWDEDSKEWILPSST